jgi:hypothetical protein
MRLHKVGQNLFVMWQIVIVHCNWGIENRMVFLSASIPNSVIIGQAVRSTSHARNATPQAEIHVLIPHRVRLIFRNLSSGNLKCVLGNLFSTNKINTSSPNPKQLQ